MPIFLRQKAQALGAACAEPVESLQAQAVGPLLAQVRQIAQRQGDGVEEYRDAPALTAFGIRRAGPLLVVATGALVLICRIEAGRAA